MATFVKLPPPRQLNRYASANISKVSTDALEETDEGVPLRRVEARGRGRGGPRGFRGGCGGYDRKGNESQQFCAGCFSLDKQLDTFIN